MENSKVLKLEGTLQEMSQGSVLTGGANARTSLKYIRINDKKYGPVQYDAKINRAIAVGNQLSLVMYKSQGKWIIMAAKLANGDIFGAELNGDKTIIIKDSFWILVSALFVFAIIWGFGINLLDLSFTFAGVGFVLSVLGAWGGFLYHELSEVSLLTDLSHTFGVDEIL